MAKGDVVFGLGSAGANSVFGHAPLKPPSGHGGGRILLLRKKHLRGGVSACSLAQRLQGIVNSPSRHFALCQRCKMWPP